MHEADDAYSIWSTWSCYWLNQFLTLALDAWILSKFSTLYWICLLLVFLILSFLYVYSDHSILECYNLFSGVELSMRSYFVILCPSISHHLFNELFYTFISLFFSLYMKMFKQNGRISLSSFEQGTLQLISWQYLQNCMADVASYKEPTSFPDIKRTQSRKVPRNG